MTIPGLGGQVPPRPDQQAGLGQGQAAAVAPGSPNVVRARLIIVSGTGPNEGLFVYNGTPASGNPPIFWATSASSDPFGNAIPSTSGVAGMGAFEAGNTVINANGAFIYSAAPAAGNLVASVAPTGGTDPFGNHYLAGTSTYAASFATSLQSGFVAFASGSLAGGWTFQSSVSGDVAGNLQVNANGQLQLVGVGSVAVTGTFTVNGSGSTGAGDNGGVTSGPSGTVNSFPAAGPNHTHAEFHHHPL